MRRATGVSVQFGIVGFASHNNLFQLHAESF